MLMAKYVNKSYVIIKNLNLERYGGKLRVMSFFSFLINKNERGINPEIRLGYIATFIQFVCCSSIYFSKTIYKVRKNDDNNTK